MRSLNIYISKFNSYIRNLERAGIKLSKLRCAFDGVLDYLVYGSTITDYFELTFWNKSHKEKSKFATWRIHKRFIYEVDDNDLIEALRNKAEMYRRLNRFVNRDQLFTKNASFEEFEAFFSRHECFFYKPCDGSCGRGIEKIYTETGDIERLFQKINKEDAVLDTPIVQHKVMSSLNQSSVNTLRIFTFRNNDSIYFLGCALRIGTNSYIDNYSAGGLVCSVDLHTGKTKDSAENNLGQRLARHPISQIELEGFQIPKWNEVLEFVFCMAQIFDLNYVAWDIAVKEDGIALIEANPGGMINTVQIAGGTPKKEIILELEKEWKDKRISHSGTYRMVLCE